MAIQLAGEAIEIVTHYELLVEGWQHGPNSYTGTGAHFGEAWKLFWAWAVDFGLPNITHVKS